MRERLLAIDIGNSNIKIGLFDEAGLKTRSTATHPLRERGFYEELLRGFLQGGGPAGGVLSSVVPSHSDLFSGLLSSLTGAPPLVVTHSLDTGLVLDVEEPGALGPDRIANAAAAYEMIRGRVAVVDLGTATTITLVDRGGRLLGGAILPGLELMCSSLSAATGRLPAVRPVPPAGPLGRETKSSIISGVVYGTAGAVERLLGEMASLTGEFVTVVTGGNGRLIRGVLRRESLFVPELTLTGLRLIYERNRVRR